MSASSPHCLALALPMLLAGGAAQAAELFSGDDWRVSLDTTVSLGASKRMQAPADNLLGKVVHDPLIARRSNTEQRAAPGRWSVNSDDANLYYADGDWISRALKVTTELGVQAGESGAFVRVSGFHDAESERRRHWARAARDRMVSDIEVLDAFAFTRWEPGGLPLDLRLGRQVLNWGESTFLQNGINGMNAVDLTRLRVAGGELREALLPAAMLDASLQFNAQWSLEGFYQFESEPTRLDPVGSYFASNDFAGDGGRYVMAGFGLAPQPVRNPDLFDAVCSGRAVSDNPAVAAEPALLAAACGNALRRIDDQRASDGGQYGFAMRYVRPDAQATEFGFYALNYHSRLPMIAGFAVTGAAPNTATVRLEYPEDIHVFGASFNTTLAASGIALQGEVSYRPNQPLQIDDVEILYAALSPLNALIPAPYNRFRSQLGEFAPGAHIPGWGRQDMLQWQMTASRVFGPGLGAEQTAVVWEVGGTHVPDLPDPATLRYQGEGTDTGGGADVLAGGGRNPITQVEGFPTQFSWGHRLLIRADYNGVFGLPVTLTPRVGFNQDINGITPGPGGNFLEGRRALTAGAELQYLGRWSLDLAYTRFSGALALNTVHDRDFAAATLRYSF